MSWFRRDEESKSTVLVTGCGFKPVGHIYQYKNRPSHNPIEIDGVEHKMNIGTAAAYRLAKEGVEVIMVSRTAENLERIKAGLIELGCKSELISFIAADITTDEGIDRLTSELPKDKNIYWVQSIGMGGGSYKVPNDNIYLPFEQISPELIQAEMQIVTATHKLMLKMVPIFRKQIQEGRKAKIVIITSMSGERGYHFGATHVAAKHAIVGYVKGIEKELVDEGIEIYDVRPGGVDTGMYDNPSTKKAVEEIGQRDKMWGDFEPYYAHPLWVAEAIYDDLFGRKPQRLRKILGPHQK